MSYKGRVTGIFPGLLLLGVLAFVAAPWPVLALDDPDDEAGEVVPSGPQKFPRRTETGIRLSKDRHIGISELWAPFYQEQDRVLYGSARVMGDNQSNFEGNLGLGYRQMFDDHIWGGYGFADHRVTALGTDIWQATFGAEYIRQNWEVRGNIYWPLQTAQTYTVDIPSGPYLAGNGIFVRGPMSLIEEAQPGFDAEAGFLLPKISDLIGDARAYGGVYYFRGQETPDILGLRARAQVDIAPWLRLGARAQYDDEREEQYFLELTMRFPGVAGTRGQGLRARLADSPERDVDIVTGATVRGGTPQPVVDMSGNPARIIYVDNTAAAGGDGTFEKPYDTLSAALGTVQAHDTVYIFAGDGTTSGYDAGYTIATSDITVMGAGSPLYFDASRYASPDGYDYDFSLLLPAGTHPLLTNPGGDIMTINADDVTLRGVQLDNALGGGVRINSGVDGTIIENVQITGNAGVGIYIEQLGSDDMNVRVRDAVISGNKNVGVLVDNQWNGLVNVDLGTASDYGLNDIYGNLGAEIYANTNGQAIVARGNYWGNDTADISGPHAGLIDQATSSGAAFCDGCRVTLTSFVDHTNAVEAAVQASNTLTATGFRGHRYIMTTTANAPDMLINNVSVGSNEAKIQAGDMVAINMTASTTGLMSKSATLFAGDIIDDWTLQTRFLPNALPTLVAWWDASDIDGDFDYGDQPANGTLLASWADKSGYGHTATAVGSARPTVVNDAVVADDSDDLMQVANSGYLSALGSGASVAMVIRGNPSAADIRALAYGTCASGITSRCLAVIEAGASDDAIVRLDTNAGTNQNTGATPMTLFDDDTHILVVSAAGGVLDVWLDDVNVVNAAYATGGGFGSTAGLMNVGPINGAYHETVVINGALGSTDRTLVTNYLKDKWNLN